MAEWLMWVALIVIAKSLSDVVSELQLLRKEIASHRNWYMEDDVE